ncbi:hypothetical protein ACP4OV_021486 [Aristida adscensionis]
MSTTTFAMARRQRLHYKRARGAEPEADGRTGDPAAMETGAQRRAVQGQGSSHSR